MKTILTSIFVFFFPLLIIGQNNLDGTYCLSLIGEFKKKVEVERITFHPNNRFESKYTFSEFKYGFGNYYIKNDSLTLQYDSCPAKIKNKIEILYSSVTTGDSVKIEMQFHYKPGELFTVTYLTISITKSENYEIGDYLVSSSIIDVDSIVTFKYKKQTGKLYLRLMGIGTNNSVFIIDGSTNYKIASYLYDSYYGRIDGVKESYKVVKNNRKGIKLKQYSNDGQEIILKYKREKK